MLKGGARHTGGEHAANCPTAAPGANLEKAGAVRERRSV